MGPQRVEGGGARAGAGEDCPQAGAMSLVGTTTATIMNTDFVENIATYVSARELAATDDHACRPP